MTAATVETGTWSPTFGRSGHGGWNVTNIRYPDGAVGCVSNNYADRKWRIVCDPRGFSYGPTFPTRAAAARAEQTLAVLAEPVLKAAVEAFRVVRDMLEAHPEMLARSPQFRDPRLLWQAAYDRLNEATQH